MFMNYNYTLQELEKLVDEGLVRSIGLSNFNSKQIQNIWDKCRIKPSNLQVREHLTFATNPNCECTGYQAFGYKA